MKYFVAIVMLLAIGFGFFFLTSNSPKAEPVGIKFFSPAEILPSDVVVKIKDNFEPSEITVKEGTRVVFVNETEKFSWPASDPHPIHTDYPEFDPLEPLASGEAWAAIFELKGTWKYHDHLSPRLRGVVIVE